MKHELFTVIVVGSIEAIPTDPEVVKFFARDITPKSISVSSLNGSVLLSIGYVPSKIQGHSFEIKQKVYSTENIIANGLPKLLEEAAGELNGVICQDISLYESDIVDSELVITFLTHIEKQS